MLGLHHDQYALHQEGLLCPHHALETSSNLVVHDCFQRCGWLHATQATLQGRDPGSAQKAYDHGQVALLAIPPRAD